MGVGGLWVKGKRAMCQLPIKKLKAMKEKTTSLAPGGLTGCLMAQFAGAFHRQVGTGIGLGVGVCEPRYEELPVRMRTF